MTQFTTTRECGNGFSVITYFRVFMVSKPCDKAGFTVTFIAKIRALPESFGVACRLFGPCACTGHSHRGQYHSENSEYGTAQSGIFAQNNFIYRLPAFLPNHLQPSSSTIAIWLISNAIYLAGLMKILYSSIEVRE
ncbi:MAG TPA: hypothetical protein VF268_05380 [Gammaproteobacteria bacterium]